MATYNCPHCGQEMSVGPDDAGLQRACPACSEPFVVPGEVAEGTAGQPERMDGRRLGAASLILGILSYPLCFLAPLAAIPAVICGHMSLGRSKGPGAPRGRAIAGLVLGYAAFAYTLFALLLAAVLLPAFMHARTAATRASCASNLKQIGVICLMFADENEGRFPPISPEAGNLAMEHDAVYPDFLSDLEVLRCRGDDDASSPPRRIDDASYVYLGHFVRDQEQLERFAEAYRAAARNDFIEPDLGGPEDEVMRLRKGAERFFITDINNPASGMKVQSTTPVMWEWPGHHKPLGGMRPGGNVLYMDGRVEYVPMGEFPMTEEAFEVLRELDALGP